MSLATLRYERAAPKTNESKQGIPIFDGTPSGFYEWEFRSMTRYHATEEEDRWKLASKLCEGLTGESLKVAMSLGIDKLAQKDGVLKLVEALRLHMFQWQLQKPENSPRQDNVLGFCLDRLVNHSSLTSPEEGDGMSC